MCLFLRRNCGAPTLYLARAKISKSAKRLKLSARRAGINFDIWRTFSHTCAPSALFLCTHINNIVLEIAITYLRSAPLSNLGHDFTNTRYRSLARNIQTNSRLCKFWLPFLYIFFFSMYILVLTLLMLLLSRGINYVDDGCTLHDVSL